MLKNRKNKTMEKHKHANRHESSLAEDARALIAATADVAGEKIDEARGRLSAALDNAKEMAGNIRDKAVAGAKATDEAVRENPYKALAIGAAVGILVGFLVGRRSKAD